MLYMLLLYAFVSCHQWWCFTYSYIISSSTLGWDVQGWQVTKAALDSLGCSIGYQGLVPTWLAAAPLEVIESIEQHHSCQFQRKTYSHKAEIHRNSTSVENSHVLVDQEAKLDEIHHNSPMFFKKKAIRERSFGTPFWSFLAIEEFACVISSSIKIDAFTITSAGDDKWTNWWSSVNSGHTKIRIAGKVQPGYGAAKICSLPMFTLSPWPDLQCRACNLDPGWLHKQFAASVGHLKFLIDTAHWNCHWLNWKSAPWPFYLTPAA